MALNSVEQLIRSLEHQPNWQQHRRFQRVLRCWSTLVGDAVATKTRPTGIQQEVLQVAVCNAVWAQNLAFERQRLLKKLNAEFSTDPFRDIRFSTAQWHSGQKTSTANQPHATSKVDDNSAINTLWSSHPCPIRRMTFDVPSPQPSSKPHLSSKLRPLTSHPHHEELSPDRLPASDKRVQSNEAFQRWADTIQRRSHHLPLCPQCQCPTPVGELKRWSSCCLCAAKSWGQSKA